MENRVLRALTDDEEAEFQRALRLAPSSKLPELEYEASGFAVMVRVRFVDGWGWDTRMRFDTYEQAAAHARKGNKIAPFGSVEWNALRQKREPALPASASAPQESRPSRYEGGTFVEFVSQLVPSPLDHHDLADRETLLPVSTNSVRTPVIKSQTLVELVLKLINKLGTAPARKDLQRTGMRDLRDLTRHRKSLVRDRVKATNRVHKLLETANIKLANVVSDVLGVSGRAMLDALTAGETDPEHLAKLARGSLIPKVKPLAEALCGRFTSHHAFLLAQMLTQLDQLAVLIARCDVARACSNGSRCRLRFSWIRSTPRFVFRPCIQPRYYLTGIGFPD